MNTINKTKYLKKTSGMYLPRVR